ncbi:unnamed protein product [Strongylus vulgaris]|uniref:Uncharacterized protein n=1 Tax=Strongylus vulgaris TaxID=40348 RepID=A0A3P7LAT0_STRVU|nr:unnamed protein product [Strongylus vulgaris]
MERHAFMAMRKQEVPYPARVQMYNRKKDEFKSAEEFLKAAIEEWYLNDVRNITYLLSPSRFFYQLTQVTMIGCQFSEDEEYKLICVWR